MRRFVPALAVLLSVSLLDARSQRLSCGSHPDRWQEELQLHREAKRSRIERLRTKGWTAQAAAPAASAPRPDIGQIALLDDSDGVVSRRNPFNLNKHTLRFVPAAGGASYRYALDKVDSYDSASAASGTPLAGLEDDDSREVSLPFPFPFFGNRYNSVFVNSDGNLTFTAGDAAITDRSLGRFHSGAPRIAGLFGDLDPSRSATGVTTHASGDRFTVSWVRVPEYTEAGIGALQTFQIRLFADGRIEMAWTEISMQEVVVGISPGRLQGAPTVVSFLNNESGEYTSSVGERFSSKEKVDIFSAAQKFYQNHEDAYDYLVIYNTLGLPADEDVVAYEVTVRNHRSGYGDPKVDVGADAGSKRRLQAILNMGPLNQYPRDPNARVPGRLTTGDTPVTVLAHETGHLFLAFASIRDEEDPRARPMLGSQQAHWRFTFNSEASLLEGNRIEDRGPNASPRFLTVATVEGFSPLDQYLMGLRAPSEVPDTFLVTQARGTTGLNGLPRVGAAFDGVRRDIRIDEIIQAEGRRTPDHTVAQKRFRFAFVLVAPAGKEPTAEELAQMETYRQAFETFYAKATNERAVADTSLRRALRVSVWPAAGVILGATGSATIAVERAPQTPLTVFLRPQNGAVETPASVVIPAGATQASFRFTGRRIGVEELIFEPADTQFETVDARIQVAEPSAVQVSIASGNFQTARPGTALSQPVRVRVTDINELPYPGVTVEARVSTGGALDRTSAVTDENGIAAFRWTPGSSAENELHASIAGGASAVATALSRPVLSGAAVVNAASFAPGLAPGSIGTLFGLNLTAGGDAEVLLNGQPVRVFYSSPRQVNFYVPAETVPGTAQILVRNPVGSSDAVPVTVAPVHPGIFFDTATGYGAITTAGTGTVTQLRPVSAGETVEIYSTGLGSVVPQSTGLSTTALTPVVNIGGQTAQVTYSGLAPGFAGLYQVNARIPAGLAPGPQPLHLILNGIRSNEVKVQVR